MVQRPAEAQRAEDAEHEPDAGLEGRLGPDGDPSGRGAGRGVGGGGGGGGVGGGGAGVTWKLGCQARGGKVQLGVAERTVAKAQRLMLGRIRERRQERL